MGTIIGGVSNREIEKRLIISRRAPYIRPNPKLTSYNILINVSTNKAVFIYNSTFKSVVFWLIYNVRKRL
jgi:hypothetical protein